MHFGLVSNRIIVTILISAVSRGAALIRGKCLLGGGAYFNVDTQRCGAY